MNIFAKLSTPALIVAAVGVAAVVVVLAIRLRSVDWQRILSGMLPGWPWW